MLDRASSSWSLLDGRELTKEDLLSKNTTLVLCPSQTAQRLDVKCQIDCRFAKGTKISSVRMVSNSRNVELYVAPESGIFQYVSTTRGVADNDEFVVDITRGFEGYLDLRLRALSLRGDKAKLTCSSIVFECQQRTVKPTTSRVNAQQQQQSDQASQMATVLMHQQQLLRAAEIRLCGHLDVVCERLSKRFEAALAIQGARLERIEATLSNHVAQTRQADERDEKVSPPTPGKQRRAQLPEEDEETAPELVLGTAAPVEMRE